MTGRLAERCTEIVTSRFLSPRLRQTRQMFAFLLPLLGYDCFSFLFFFFSFTFEIPPWLLIDAVASKIARCLEKSSQTLRMSLSRVAAKTKVPQMFVCYTTMMSTTLSTLNLNIL